MQTLLVTVDALRADRLGQYGYERDPMPVLDRLVEAGTVFENAFSNGPYTRISIPSFHASQHLAYEDVDRFPTMASVLSAAGVRTAVVGTQTGIGLVDGDFRFDETFDLGRDEFHETANRDRSLLEGLKYRLSRPATRVGAYLEERGMSEVYGLLKRPYDRVIGDSGFEFLGYTSAETVTDRALDWLDSNADADFFLWIHYMEAHRPYGVHDDDPAYLDTPLDTERVKALMKKAGTRPADVTEEERELMGDLYDSDVRYCSRHVARLFDGMERLGIWEGSNVLFSSDHGEEFREHGYFYHRNYPFDELIHVPLIVKSPTIDAEPRITDVRELLDLAPTITSFHLSEPVPGFAGQHLLEGDPRTVFVLGQPPGTDPTVSVRTERWKYVFNEGGEQLYDLVNDPREREDVAPDEPGVADRLRRRIPTELISREVKDVRDPEDEVDREQLEALGYMELRD